MFLYTGRSEKYININGVFPNGTIPDSDGNIFVKVEGMVIKSFFSMQKKKEMTV